MLNLTSNSNPRAFLDRLCPGGGINCQFSGVFLIWWNHCPYGRNKLKIIKIVVEFTISRTNRVYNLIRTNCPLKRLERATLEWILNQAALYLYIFSACKLVSYNPPTFTSFFVLKAARGGTLIKITTVVCISHDCLDCTTYRNQRLIWLFLN